MTLVEGEELQRLWALVSELSSQLTANQALSQSLQAQADELKGQALHTGTGYTLRRFNLDISKEKFESDLEKLNAQLVHENQSLAHENKQINLLLREYEGILETIMSKFRAFSHATQQHTLQLTSHYESILACNSYEAERTDLHTNTAFSEQLAHLGSLVRLALREVEGEAFDDEDGSNEGNGPEDARGPFDVEGYRVGSPSGGLSRSIVTQVPSPPSTGTSTPSRGKERKGRKGYGSSRSRDPRWYGTGGYTGFQGDPEAECSGRALETHIEEERLRKENEILRDLLRVSTDLTPDVAQKFGISSPAMGPDESGAPKLSLGKPRGAQLREAKEAAQNVVTTSQGSQYIHNLDDVSSRSKEEDNSLSSSGDVPAADQVLSISPTRSHITPPHDIQGAGCPPQLSSGGNSLLMSDSGLMVTSEERSGQTVESALQSINSHSPERIGHIDASAENSKDNSGADSHADNELNKSDDPSVNAPLQSGNSSKARQKLLEETEESLGITSDSDSHDVPESKGN